MLGTEACNIRIQPLQHMQHLDLFCNIHKKHLQYTFETYETLETYACNMRFQRNIFLVLGRLEARWCAEFTGRNGPAAVAPRRGGEEAAARLGEGSHAPRLLAWPRVAPGSDSGQSLRLGGGRPRRSTPRRWRTLRVPHAWSSRWPLLLERI